MQSKAVLLIPCCSRKRGLPHGQTLPPAPAPLAGVDELRARLWETLRRQSNPPPGPWLDPAAPAAPAYQLYQGVPYRLLGQSWPRLMAEISTDLLIVSAAYGLVQPTEIVTQYDLTMGRRLDGSGLVFRFWQKAGLADVLREYVRSKEITHVWSLLPDSAASSTQYHKVFRQFWLQSRGTICRRVKAENLKGRSAGSGSGDCRGRWLAAVLQRDPGLLSAKEDRLAETQGLVPGYTIRFHGC